jgi:hypothetical protein
MNKFIEVHITLATVMNLPPILNLLQLYVVDYLFVCPYPTGDIKIGVRLPSDILPILYHNAIGFYTKIEIV